MDRVSHCSKEEKKVWRKVSEEGLDVVASELKKILEKPSVIILSGEVGAGKTTFTKKFVGTQGSVYSPSYSLINEVGDYHKIFRPEFYDYWVDNFESYKDEIDTNSKNIGKYISNSDIFLLNHKLGRF